MIWQAVLSPALMVHVAFPLVTFRSLESGGFPEQWREGSHRVSMRAFGIIPLGSQTIGISFPAPPRENIYVLRDLGTGTMARVWDHTIMVVPENAGGTLYSDTLDVKAGWLTPLTAVFARLLFAWRQRRLAGLVRRGQLSRVVKALSQS